MELGFDVSVPYGENCKYDLVVDDRRGNLYRMQCKTSRKRTEFSFDIHTAHRHNNMKGGKWIFYTKKDIDFFCTIYNGVCYVIDVKYGRRRTLTLKLDGYNSKTGTPLSASKFIDYKVFGIDDVSRDELNDGKTDNFCAIKKNLGG